MKCKHFQSRSYPKLSTVQPAKKSFMLLLLNTLSWWEETEQLRKMSKFNASLICTGKSFQATAVNLPLSQFSLCSLGTSVTWSPAVLGSMEGWWFWILIWSSLSQTWEVFCQLLLQLLVPSLESERVRINLTKRNGGSSANQWCLEGLVGKMWWR